MSAPLHILVVDPQPDSVSDMLGRLAARTHRVQVVRSGLDAMARMAQARAANDPIALLFVDYQLNDVNAVALSLIHI
jgi:CheY-like chemotaxis protein